MDKRRTIVGGALVIFGNAYGYVRFAMDWIGRSTVGDDASQLWTTAKPMIQAIQEQPVLQVYAMWAGAVAIGLWVIFQPAIMRMIRSQKPKPLEVTPVTNDKSVNFNHYGTGHQFNADTINFGKPERVFGPADFAEVHRKLGDRKAASVMWVGSEKSSALYEKVVLYLEERGLKVERRGRTQNAISPFEGPLIVDEELVIVDASK